MDNKPVTSRFGRYQVLPVKEVSLSIYYCRITCSKFHFQVQSDRFIQSSIRKEIIMYKLWMWTTTDNQKIISSRLQSPNFLFQMYSMFPCSHPAADTWPTQGISCWSSPELHMLPRLDWGTQKQRAAIDGWGRALLRSLEWTHSRITEVWCGCTPK